MYPLLQKEKKIRKIFFILKLGWTVNKIYLGYVSCQNKLKQQKDTGVPIKRNLGLTIRIILLYTETAFIDIKHSFCLYLLVNDTRKLHD